MHSSFFARHDTTTSSHLFVMYFHAAWAVVCWAMFVSQWVLPKRTHSHIQRGRFLFWGFLVPLEISGLMLIPYLFSSMPRSNLTKSSGHLIVPSMNFHILITTFRAFPFWGVKFWRPIIKWLSFGNFGLQIFLCSTLSYKVFWHVEPGVLHEYNIELFIITLLFTITQAILIFRPHLQMLGHSFYIKYLTLQMFPGTTIIIARDRYWLWGPNGVENMYLRLFIILGPTIPFFKMVLPTLLAPRRKKVA